MTDIYVSYADGPTLEIFANAFTSHVPCVQGVAATPDIAAVYAADGVTVLTPEQPAQAAKGDPSLWYTLIRAPFDITPIVVAPFAVVVINLPRNSLGSIKRSNN